MKLKKFLIGGLLAMLVFTSVFALVPNIAGRPLLTGANPNTYYTIIQSSTTQGKISMANFANSISGVLGLSGFLTGFTESDPIWTTASGKYLSLSGNTPTSMIDGNVYLDYDNILYIADPADITNNNFTIGYDGYTADIFNRQGPSSYGEFQINGIYPALVSFTGGQTSQVNMSNHGLEYAADYSGAYTDRSLVDKGYVDRKFITGLSYMGLTNNYIPYRSGSKFYNSNMLFYTNTHVGTYSAGDIALFNIRKIGSSLKGINITLYTGGLYNGIGLDIRASRPIITTTQNIGDPLNTTNIANNSDDNGGYFMTNYVSNIGGYSSMISKGGIVGVANGASVSTGSPAGFYIMSGASSLAATNGSRRIVMSGANLSIQVLSGGVWIEKGQFTP